MRLIEIKGRGRQETDRVDRICHQLMTDASVGSFGRDQMYCIRYWPVARNKAVASVMI